MADEFQVCGRNAEAQFTLKLHRGDGMTLVAMNWRNGKPPKSFVGFAIEYKEPGSSRCSTRPLPTRRPRSGSWPTT